MKKYKLKKDFPGSKIGDVWVKAEDNVMSPEGKGNIKMHESLFKPFKEWFDKYKEPEVGYIIDPMEEDCVSSEHYSGYEESDIERAKELGIWFKTEEETERAVKKLKAWKRLRDKGYKFGGWYFEYTKQEWVIKLKPETYEEFVIGQTKQDLDLLFGGEE